MQQETNPRQLSRRTFLRASMGVMGMVTLAACVAPQSGAAPVGVAQAPTTIRFGRHDPGGGVDATIKAFEEANPTIKVAMEQIQPFDQKIPALAAAGSLPDVVRSWEAMCIQMGHDKQFIDLQSYVDAQADLHPEDFYESAWMYPVVEGKRFAIPDVAAPHVTFYNVDLFEKKGVEPPKLDKFTWSDFEEKARAISDPDNKIWGSETIPVGWHYYTWKQVRQNGGDFFTADYKTCVLDKTEAIEGVQYWADLLLDGHVMPSPSQITGMGGEGAAAQLMSAGKIGMQRMGSWIINDLMTAKIKFNMVPEPSKVRPETILHGGLNAISTTSTHKDEAWKWIAYNTGTQGLYNYCVAGKFAAVRRSTNKMEPHSWVTQVDFDVNWDVIPQTLEYGHILPGPLNEGEALKVIGDALQKIYAGEVKAKDIFPEIAPKVTQIIQG